jgi:hypothetical protein
MRDQHPVFDAEVNRDTTVWRYFDLPRFLSFLQNEALYFCRADLLGDPLEGSFTKATSAERERAIENRPAGMTKDAAEDSIRRNSALCRKFLQQAYVNCWHCGPHESMEMWRGYGGGPYGVAIRTTFGALDDTLPTQFVCTRKDPIYVGPVK